MNFRLWSELTNDSGMPARNELNNPMAISFPTLKNTQSPPSQELEHAFDAFLPVAPPEAEKKSVTIMRQPQNSIASSMAHIERDITKLRVKTPPSGLLTISDRSVDLMTLVQLL